MAQAGDVGCDFPELVRFIGGAALLAERCKRYLVSEEPARETFDDFMGKLAVIRTRYRQLPQAQRTALMAPVLALEDDASILKHLVVGRRAA